MMFQSYALFPHMNVIENVGYGLRMSGVKKDEATSRARDALKGVGLVGFDERLPSELSGGQQQRVALARALVLEPAVLLFDEPLSNLDARLRREMREEIRALQQRLKLTVAYVTHDQSEALAVSDQIIVMDHGLIAQRGTPEQLYGRPESEFVAGFMGEAMVFPAMAQADGSVTFGPLRLQPRHAVAPGAVKVAVRPEAWEIGAAERGAGPARHAAKGGLPGELLRIRLRHLARAGVRGVDRSFAPPGRGRAGHAVAGGARRQRGARRMKQWRHERGFRSWRRAAGMGAHPAGADSSSRTRLH